MTGTPVDWWPCGCSKGGGKGKPSTHIKLNSPNVTKCPRCGFTNRQPPVTLETALSLARYRSSVDGRLRSFMPHHIDALIKVLKPFLTTKPAPDDELDIYVPAAWTCPTCHCGLSQASFSAASGEVGITAQDIAREPTCPNDCGPMVRVRWRDRALESDAAYVRDMERLMKATGTDNWPAAFKQLESATPQACATCLHHNPEGPLCRRGVSRPNSIAPDRRTDKFNFGCTLHDEKPDAQEGSR